MKEQIKYGGKTFKYMITFGARGRIYSRGRKQVIVDKRGNIEPHRDVLLAKGESK